MSGRSRPKLSATQVTAAGAGTVMATVAGSYLGVAGTLLGAGLMSVMTTAGGAILQHYLDRGSRRVRNATARKISTVRAERRDARPETRTDTQTDTPSGGRPAVPSGERSGEQIGERPGERTVEFRVPRDPADAAAPDRTTEPDTSAAPDGTTEADAGAAPARTAELDTADRADGAGGTHAARDTGGTRGRTRWLPVMLQAAAVFALVVAGVFAFEVLTGKPLASTVRGEFGTGTSLTGGRTLPSEPTPAPEPSEPATETPDATPTTSPPESPDEPTTAPPRPSPRPPTRPTTRPPTSRPPGTVPTTRPAG